MVGVFAIMGFIVAVIVAIGCCTCYNGKLVIKIHAFRYEVLYDERVMHSAYYCIIAHISYMW